MAQESQDLHQQATSGTVAAGAAATGGGAAGMAGGLGIGAAMGLLVGWIVGRNRGEGQRGNLGAVTRSSGGAVATGGRDPLRRLVTP